MLTAAACDKRAVFARVAVVALASRLARAPAVAQIAPAVAAVPPPVARTARSFSREEAVAAAIVSKASIGVRLATSRGISATPR